MATRTVNFLGYAANGDANIVATFNNTQVFSGIVSNTQSYSGAPLITNQVLFSCNIDCSLSGNIPLSIQAVSGNVIVVGDIFANYGNSGIATSATINGTYHANIGNITQFCLSTFGNTTGVTVTNRAHNIITSGPSVFSAINGNQIDSKNDQVYINNVLVPVNRPVSTPHGAITYTIVPGQTLTCNVEVAAGVAANVVTPFTYP
jgi:hypothetical protein